MTKNSPVAEQGQMEEKHNKNEESSAYLAVDDLERFFQLGSYLFNEKTDVDGEDPVIQTCGQILKFFDDYHAEAFLDYGLGIVFDRVGSFSTEHGDHFVYGFYTTKENGEQVNNFFVTAFNRTSRDDDSKLDVITAYAWVSGEVEIDEDDNDKPYFIPGLICVPEVDPDHPDEVSFVHSELDPEKMTNLCHGFLFLESALVIMAAGEPFPAFDIEKNNFVYGDLSRLIPELHKKCTARTLVNFSEDINDVRDAFKIQRAPSPQPATVPSTSDVCSDFQAATTASEYPVEKEDSADMVESIPRDNFLGMFQIDNPDYFHQVPKADISDNVFSVIQDMMDQAECSAVSDLEPDAPISNLSLRFACNPLKAMAAYVEYDIQTDDSVKRRAVLIVGQEEKFIQDGGKVEKYRPYCILAGEFYTHSDEQTTLFRVDAAHLRINQNPFNPTSADAIAFLEGQGILMTGACYANETIQFIAQQCRLDTRLHQRWVSEADDVVGQAFVEACGRTVEEFATQINRDADEFYAEELSKRLDHRFFYPFPLSLSIQ
ncbi:MAG: hypothetical protein PHX61_01460 [Alphaproteobacteria bacterium]|nr:hypothetical protein [Alphaproteobacteria bacterium]